MITEMGMRGAGQIAWLASFVRPDVGVITNIGPAHIEFLGSLENIAAAKAELIDALPAGGVAVVPADEPLLEPHLRRDDLFINRISDDDAAAVRDELLGEASAHEHAHGRCRRALPRDPAAGRRR